MVQKPRNTGLKCGLYNSVTLLKNHWIVKLFKDL